MCKQNDFLPSRFFCTHCHQEGLPCLRKSGRYREPGHLKRLYCPHCKEVWNHVEVRPIGGYTYEDFLLEVKYDNFDENGNRKKHLKNLKHELRQKGLFND